MDQTPRNPQHQEAAKARTSRETSGVASPGHMNSTVSSKSVIALRSLHKIHLRTAETYAVAAVAYLARYTLYAEVKPGAYDAG